MKKLEDAEDTMERVQEEPTYESGGERQDEEESRINVDHLDAESEESDAPTDLLQEEYKDLLK